MAGFFLDRDGYATNIFTGNDVDDREMFGLRSSTKFEFGDTRADLVVSYFKEDDRRLTRSEKDAVLGCSPLQVGFGTPDSRGTLFNTLGASIHWALSPGLLQLALALRRWTITQIV